MIHKTIFSDQINVFWEDDNSRSTYSFFIDGELIGSSEKRFFSFTSLIPDRLYEVSIFQGKKVIFKEKIKTLKVINEIDVKKELGLFSSNDILSARIQKIIDDAPSGSTLRFSKGTYLTGALIINKPLEIRLDKDAMILGSPNPVDYLPLCSSRFEGMVVDTYLSLFNVGKFDLTGSKNLSSVIFRGQGTIFGGGNTLGEQIIQNEINQNHCDYLTASRKRGRLLHIANANDIKIDGLTLGQSPSWNLHLIYCSDIVIGNCKFSSYSIHNGDGVDIDSCHDCYIYDCLFDVGDDCIALKSGKYTNEKIPFFPVEHVKVSYCSSERGHGLAIGSEVSGGINDVLVSDCDFTKSLFGLHVKTTSKRGGYVRNIKVQRCFLSTINLESNVDYNNDGDSSTTLTDFTEFCFKDNVISGITYDNPDAKDFCNHIKVDGFKNDASRFSHLRFENTVIDVHPESHFEETIVNNASDVVFLNMIKRYK